MRLPGDAITPFCAQSAQRRDTICAASHDTRLCKSTLRAPYFSLLCEQLASEAVARQLKVTRGAMVQAVAPNSAAAKAGLLPTRRALSGIVAGDVITGLDSRPVTKPGAPVQAIARPRPLVTPVWTI